MKTNPGSEKRLPLIIEPDSCCGRIDVREYLLHLCLNHLDTLREEPLAHGALLVRGAPVLTANEFAEFVRCFSGRLWPSEIRPVMASHPLTGDEVWFNQADGFHPSALDKETYQALSSTVPEEEFRLNSYFGDGTPIDTAALSHIREVTEREVVPVKWQDGDILILDNMLAAHWRMPFTGTRKIILAMT
jgi:hypothetical protein